ncbi:MAG: DnaJ C-terminal domain-containing protein [Actinomycetaceae bacterium]|nr:DnaJ C-terminal domain-containing protein [Actinomycetaceae bacterium]
MAGQDWIEKDFYKILGVKKDADQQTIKKAYRKLARKYHPDQNKGDAHAESKFKQVGEAYQVLSNPQQRKQYDALRAMAGGGPRFTAGPGGSGASGFEDVFASMFGASPGGAGSAGGSNNYHYYQGGGFNDILSGLFSGQQPSSASQGYGGGGPFGFGGRSDKGQDLAASTELPFSQAVQGATLKLSVEGRSMTVRIPPGVQDGQKLRLKGKGRPSPTGGKPGDLVVSVTVKPHPIYSIKNKALHMVLPISVDEAINGAKVAVPLLDGTTVNVKIPQGTSSDTILRVKGRGIPSSRDKAGDLYIRTRIVVGTSPSTKVKKLAAELGKADIDFEPRADFDHRMNTHAA